MSGAMIAMLIGAVAALVLAMRGLQSQGLTFERKMWMGAIWIAIIIVLAFALQRFAA